MTRILTVNCHARELGERIAWAVEIARARRLPGCRDAVLIHPSELPTDEQLRALWPVKGKRCQT